jgi:hypothetical protein
MVALGSALILFNRNILATVTRHIIMTTQYLIQCIPGFVLQRIIWLEHEADRSPPPIQIFISITPIQLYLGSANSCCIRQSLLFQWILIRVVRISSSR